MELIAQPLLEILMGQTEHTGAPSLICLFICLLNMLLCYLLSFTLTSRDQERKKQVTKEYRMFILHLLFEQNHKILKVPLKKHFSPLKRFNYVRKGSLLMFLFNKYFASFNSIHLYIYNYEDVFVYVYTHVFIYS